MRILVVDDDDIALDLLSHALQQMGHEVTLAHDGRQALQLVRETGIHLVISDWEMPAMNGLELCRALRDDPTVGYVYFILLTSREGTDQVVEGLGAGADDFITKPFHPAEMAVRIRAGERVLMLETRDLTIFALAKLAESRDPETGAHLERVRNYSRLLATELGAMPKFAGIITPQFIQRIYSTSPLHDIGKVAIPDCVLLKPGRLSDREFEIMKTHAALGAQTLAAALRQHPNAEFLQMAYDIAISHHERFDGTGYPNGLRGEKIPLAGRIVALADVYDALTSKRVYKDAFNHDIAVSLISNDIGTHFDPDIVQAFLARAADFDIIRTRYNDAIGDNTPAPSQTAQLCR